MLNDVWQVIKVICELSPMDLWPDILAYVCTEWKDTNAILTAKKLIFLGFVYHVWLDRNNRAVHNSYRDYQQLLLDVFCNVLSKITFLIASTKMDADILELLLSWESQIN